MRLVWIRDQFVNLDAIVRVSHTEASPGRHGGGMPEFGGWVELPVDECVTAFLADGRMLRFEGEEIAPFLAAVGGPTFPTLVEGERTNPFEAAEGRPSG